MKKLNAGKFYTKLVSKKNFTPLSGHFDLTYRCNLECIHCYVKGSEEKSKELTTNQWKKIIDQIKDAGCLFLNLSGGEPLIRKDFIDIYDYAKRAGFVISIFTNGLAFDQKLIRYLIKSPPNSIEITLNGINKTTYQAITQTKGAFQKVIKNIYALKDAKIKVILKANFMRQNKAEIVKIKEWSEELLGRPGNNRYRFKCSTVLYPKLNCGKDPLKLRLSFQETIDIMRKDPDLWNEYLRQRQADFPDLARDKNYLYHCNSWMEQFFVDPYGMLKFCVFSDKYSTDLKTTPFQEGFYGVFPRILEEKFKSNSKCISCDLRPVCYYCPARALLETGDEEAPVPYYCELAKATATEMQKKQKN